MIEQYGIQINDYIYVKDNFMYGLFILYKQDPYRIADVDKSKRGEKIFIHDHNTNLGVWIPLKWFDLIRFKRVKDTKNILH
jgi:hypothetical protein